MGCHVVPAGFRTRFAIGLSDPAFELAEAAVILVASLLGRRLPLFLPASFVRCQDVGKGNIM